jgi:hypothetical protein
MASGSESGADVTQFDAQALAVGRRLNRRGFMGIVGKVSAVAAISLAGGLPVFEAEKITALACIQCVGCDDICRQPAAQTSCTYGLFYPDSGTTSYYQCAFICGINNSCHAHMPSTSQGGCPDCSLIQNC